MCQLPSFDNASILDMNLGGLELQLVVVDVLAQLLTRDDLFLRLTLSRTQAVVGEPINVSLKLYQRVSVAGFEDARCPSFNGFWSQETVSPSNIEFRRENVGGEIFNTAVIRSWNLIPQRAGDFRIEPAELVCLVNVRNAAASSGSIFDSFFQAAL